MDRLTDSPDYPEVTGKLRPGQIAQRSTWTAVPDAQVAKAAMAVIHVRPSNGSTATVVNTLDPTTATDAERAEGQGYLRPDGDHGRVHPAGRRL